MAGATIGYRYTPPASFAFEVVSLQGHDLSLDIARQTLGVTEDALGAQYRGMFSPGDIAQTVDESDALMTMARARDLLEPEQLGRPAYRYGRIQSAAIGQGSGWTVISLGVAKYADGRRRLGRLLNPDPEAAANLADIGDVYVGVSPSLNVSGSLFRGHGVGSATLHCMLDRYPDDMATVLYEHPEVNPTILPTIRGLGFSAIRKPRLVEFCGHQVRMFLYGGPTVRELRQNMEERRPWLQERQPVTAES